MWNRTAGVKKGMDGSGQTLDNVFIEQLRWSMKYAHANWHGRMMGPSLERGLEIGLEEFNRKRPRQYLVYHTPRNVVLQSGVCAGP